jgi:ceramide glucosyltransferase
VVDASMRLAQKDSFASEFTLKLVAWLWLFFTLAAISGCIYAFFAAALLRRFAQKPPIPLLSAPNLTILKPLCGAEPELETNLASFCDQAYPGEIQLVFGIHYPDDPAGAIVQRLRERFPTRDIALAVNPDEHGANPKVSNLINMLPEARHDLVVLSDSDIRVERDYLQVLVAELAKPGVGLVTYLYRGFPVGGIWSSLSAAAINEHFLPSVLVGLKLGLAHPCFGATIALRKETLSRIGGFEAFAEQLADDYAIGEAVRGLGLEVAIAPMLVGHACSEQSLGQLLRHELRWARTLRLLDPWGYAGLVLTHALPLALVAAALDGFGPIGLGTIALALACRLSIPIQVKALPGGGSPWLSPFRDLLSFAVFLASFLPGPLSWRGRQYLPRSDGTLTKT